MHGSGWPFANHCWARLPCARRQRWARKRLSASGPCKRQNGLAPDRRNNRSAGGEPTAHHARQSAWRQHHVRRHQQVFEGGSALGGLWTGIGKQAARRPRQNHALGPSSACPRQHQPGEQRRCVAPSLGNHFPVVDAHWDGSRRDQDASSSRNCNDMSYHSQNFGSSKLAVGFRNGTFSATQADDGLLVRDSGF